MATVELSHQESFEAELSKLNSPRIVFAPGAFDGPRTFAMRDAGVIHQISISDTGMLVKDCIDSVMRELKTRLEEGMKLIPDERSDADKKSDPFAVPLVVDLYLDVDDKRAAKSATIRGYIWATHPRLAITADPFQPQK